jgi:hypothetical protein
MNDISFSEARQLAVKAIETLAQEEHLGDLMILDEAVVETDSAWYFPYDSTAFIVHGNISAALAGNLPARVPKDGASVTFVQPQS